MLPKYFFPRSISNFLVNCKVSDLNIVWCGRYKKEKFIREKNTSAGFDAPLNNSDRGDN
jgi:hypothetical protein